MLVLYNDVNKVIQFDTKLRSFDSNTLWWEQHLFYRFDIHSCSLLGLVLSDVSVRRLIKAPGVCRLLLYKAMVSAVLCVLLASLDPAWCGEVSCYLSLIHMRADTHMHIRVIGWALLFSRSLWPMFKTKTDQVYVPLIQSYAVLALTCNFILFVFWLLRLGCASCWGANNLALLSRSWYQWASMMMLSL